MRDVVRDEAGDEELAVAGLHAHAQRLVRVRAGLRERVGPQLVREADPLPARAAGLALEAWQARPAG